MSTSLTLTPAEITAAAQRLDAAEKSRSACGQLSLDHPAMGIDDAYAVQKAWVAMKIAEGRRVIGHKIGLTSRAMQQSSQIDEPDFGTLLDDMAFPEGSDIPCSRFITPMLEVELAFILKHPLQGEHVSVTDVLSATDYVIPALEIIDARCHRIDPASKRPRKVFDTISDNAANAGIVLGGRPVKPMDVDLRWVSAILYRNGVIEETGVAAGVLNHPANGICWLSKRFAPHNIALEPGQIVLAGSFTRPVPARPGDVFHVDYGPLGAIACRFV
ncbi:2-oxo-hept-4-ene-1,7-dioate hydratase [Insolitispirillum peregrinum]|uniref:2-oxohept-3-enedioate hydratase n=1 Tax=Insolitispirillum peregrinum TaxID=80876 RepID=A0A1N7NDM4_9PROT|nr:2-oxo-hepta-3-ene-1,7-dioic acid hydratase [Insolitispirillum peregrinum]SIS96309.1 2-oxohept-3-enedioate hydratase [Insolitispirillum peregrinum]